MKQELNKYEYVWLQAWLAEAGCTTGRNPEVWADECLDAFINRQARFADGEPEKSPTIGDFADMITKK